MLPANHGLTCIVGAWNELVSDSITRPEDGYRKNNGDLPSHVRITQRARARWSL